MAGGTRKDRLESLLHREIATCITNEVRDPRIGFITITRVEMTKDLQNVTAYYTLLEAKDAQRRAAARALEGVRSFVQRQYAPYLRMRHLPRLQFEYDEKQVQRNSIDDLIRQARASDPNPSTGEDDVERDA